MASWRLRVEVVPALPRLAWLAELPRAGGEVRAVCGTAVEHADEWLVEGVWDAPFEAGDFDRSEAFFGSGLRLRGGRALLVASTATVDRLLFAELRERIVVANSLPLVLAAIGARLELEHDYFDEAAPARRGIHGQPHPMRVRHAETRTLLQLLHGNLELEGGVASVALRSRPRPIADYEAYLGLLVTAIAELGGNLASAGRRRPLAPFATVSAGYDSPAVACLTRAAGVREAFATRPGPPPSAQLEDGAAVATALGLEPRPLAPAATGIGAHEIEFLAGVVAGAETALHGIAAALELRPEPSVLFTGYHGDVVWEGRAGRPVAGEDLARSSDDGPGLCEVRLSSGFVHAPLPFLFARNAGELRRISLSDEMSPWRLGTDYDRPIPRRILESSGVPRRLIAREKRALWEAVFEVPSNRELRAEFEAWIERRMPGAELRLRLHRRLTAFDRELFRRSWRLSPRRPPHLPLRLQRLPLRGHSARQLLFKWANEALADRRARELAAAGLRLAGTGRFPV